MEEASLAWEVMSCFSSSRVVASPMATAAQKSQWCREDLRQREKLGHGCAWARWVGDAAT
jgi:hypothetical protein